MDAEASAKCEKELKAIVLREALDWSRKPIGVLRQALKEAIGYERDGDEGWLQFEVLVLEDEADYVHVGVTVDDGSERWSRSPIGASFLVYSNGRVDI